MKPVADEAMAASPTVEHVLVLRRAGNEVGMAAGRDIWWHDVVPGASPVCETVETRANEPYMVIYTSGTTGDRKARSMFMPGFPIKAAHDLAYCFDLHDDDVLFWYTDLGWMMGPWAIGGGPDARRNPDACSKARPITRIRIGSGRSSSGTG